jgi:uncharacterized membrane protein YraQ (UPF0718 family)
LDSYMYVLYIVKAIALLLSFSRDKQKTVDALKIAWKKLNNVLPKYLLLLIIISGVLLISQKQIISLLTGSSVWISLLTSLGLGSIIMMPGFVAYPLAGVLVKQGVSYMVVSAFVTTLMMVGFVTFPVEKEYLGVRLALYRNIIALISALIISIFIGIFYGEIL